MSFYERMAQLLAAGKTAEAENLYIAVLIGDCIPELDFPEEGSGRQT